MRTLLTLAALTSALPLLAAPLVLESFDVSGPLPTRLGEGNALGGQTSVGWMSSWVVQSGAGSLLRSDLRLPGLASTRGLATTRGNSTWVRQLGVSLTGDAYGSFRVRCPKTPPNAVVALMIALPGMEEVTPRTALVSFVVKGWQSPRGTLGVGGQLAPIQEGVGIPEGETALALWKMENLPAAGGRSDVTVRYWILGEAQAAHFAANGLTEEALAAAAVGAEPDQVLQRAEMVRRGSKLTLVEGLVVACSAKFIERAQFDEIRFSNVSLADAAGVEASGVAEVPPGD